MTLETLKRYDREIEKCKKRLLECVTKSCVEHNERKLLKLVNKKVILQKFKQKKRH